MDPFVQPRHLPRQGQKQRKRVFRDAHGVSTGRAHHQHAALRGRLQINVVHAHTGAPHRAQLWSFGEQIRGDFRSAAHDQGIRVRNFPFERIFRRHHRVPARLFLQQLHAPLADLVGDDDFDSASLWRGLFLGFLRNRYDFAC